MSEPTPAHQAVEISFTPLRSEHRAAYQFAWRRAMGRLFPLYLAVIMLATLAFGYGAVTLLLIALDKVDEVAYNQASQAAFFTFVGIVIANIAKAALRDKFNNAYYAPTSAAMSLHVMTLDDKGITLQHGSVTEQVLWQQVLLWKEDKKLVYFQVEQGRALFIPRRVIEDKAHLDQLRDFISARLAAVKKGGGVFKCKEKQKNKGLSLIELAMVMAIIAPALAGIWVTVSTVNENLKVSETAKVLIQVVEKARILFSGPMMPTTAYGPSNNISAAVIASGGVPSSWIMPSSKDYFVSPFGTKGAARAGDYYGRPSVGFYLSLPSASAANKLINHLIMRDGNPLKITYAGCYLWNGTNAVGTYAVTITAPTPANCPEATSTTPVDVAVVFDQ